MVKPEPYSMVKLEPGNSPASLVAPPKKRKFDDTNRTPRTSDVMMGFMAGSVPDSPLNPRGRNTPQRAPSASGQTSSLPLADMALEIRQMQVDKTSFGLVREMQEIDMGHGLLPSESRDHMTKHLLENNQHFHIWKSAFMEGPDTLPGNFPGWARLANFREKARDCFDQGQDESAWTMEVYYRLLSRTFRAPLGSEKGNLDFTPCASARPHESFMSQSAGSKMVDFCLFDATRDDEAALRGLAPTTPTFSVNHTDYAPLQLRPIVLGITTAPPSGDLEATRLQVGEWHRAQWRFLRSIVMKKIAAVESDEAAIHRLADKELRKLCYIPGVIVQGHRWLLVYSMIQPEHNQVMFWTELEFGSTLSIMKSYQVIAGLRHLARWANDVYMPWFRSNCY